MHSGCKENLIRPFQEISKLKVMALAQESEEFYDALCSPSSDNTSLKSFDSDTGKQYLPCNNSVDSSCAALSKNCMCGSGSDCTCKLKNGHCDFPGSTVVMSLSVGELPSTKGARRTLVPPKAEHGFSLWSLVKHCMGKDLTKIPLPVYFNEPLSTLQRLTEEYEYADLLKTASQCEDSCEQMVYIAAFLISSYSSSSKRTGKPFNPLLGETFECDRANDLGWRCISEQVSHHPPVLAQHCEGPGWVAWQQFTMTTKLKGASLLVSPVGTNHLKFTNTGHHYTWNKVSTTVHNLVIGTLWVDHHGDIKLKNHTTGDQCIVTFLPYRCFSSDAYRKVTGVVKDKDSVTKWMMQGTWDQKIEAAKVTSAEEENNIKTENFKLIWKRIPPSVEDDKYYNMTLLACQLNEPEYGTAPTDSRLRPDQRQMENGLWDEANATKVELEEKQRTKRRLHKEMAEKTGDDGSYTQPPPAWFKLETDPTTDDPIHIFTGEYWNCKSQGDWSRCPDIFL